VISFETGVRIKRPIEEVFAFVSDPIQFPVWNSAVQTVNGTPGGTGELSSTYSMERELPTGRVENGLKVFARKRPSEFGISTTTGPTPFVYHYEFASDAADTIVHLEATVALPGVAGVLGPLASRGIRRGVDANFADLKRTLEGSARSA
jgi:hypothetical protein